MTTPTLPLPRAAAAAPAVAPTRATDHESLARPRLLTTALVLGSVAAAAGAIAIGGETGARAALADPDLARLLRAMAVIKGAMFAAALGALGWRFRRPVAPAFGAAYLALAWTAAGSIGAMWQLAAPGTVAVVLHAAGAALLVAAWRDPDFLPRPRPHA